MREIRALQDRTQDIRDHWGSYAADARADANQAARARAAFPQAAAEWAAPGIPTTILLGKEDWPQGWRAWDDRALPWVQLPTGTALCGGAGGGGCHRRSSACSEWTCAPGGLIAFWVTPLPDVWGSSEGAQGLAVGRDVTYAAVKGIGLVAFPGTATEGVGRSSRIPRVLGTKEGLPSLFVTGMAPHGDQLWLAYCDRERLGGRDRETEAGIGTYDPRTGEWHALHCSTLPQEHPLSSGRLWVAHDLTAVGGQCLFSVAGSPGGSYADGFLGLWSLDDSGDGAQKLFKGGYTGPVVVTADGLLWHGGLFLATVDAQSQLVQVLMGRGGLPGAGAWRVTQEPFFPGAIPEGGIFPPHGLGARIDMATAVIHHDQLWSLVGQRIAVVDRGETLQGLLSEQHP